MSDTKAQILEALDALPEDRQREVLDYVESLRAKDDSRSKNRRRNPEDDPILDVIGSVNADLGSDRIDEILYGEDPA